MKVLITGSSGLIGSQVASDLAASDDTVVGYDLSTGQDILDPIRLRSAALMHRWSGPSVPAGTPASWALSPLA